jgi:hypothetical protein
MPGGRYGQVGKVLTLAYSNGGLPAASEGGGNRGWCVLGLA